MNLRPSVPKTDVLPTELLTDMEATPTLAEGFLGNEPSELLYSISQYIYFTISSSGTLGLGLDVPHLKER